MKTHVTLPRHYPQAHSHPRRPLSGRLRWGFLTVASALLVLTPSNRAATLVSGGVSGTWSRPGSPYIVTDSLTVPSGATLRIEPGVVVQVASSSQFTVYGALVAVGTRTDRISFSSLNATSYWNTVLLDGQSGPASRIEFCDFRNATNALSIRIVNQNATLNVPIANCRFTNCLDYAINCYAHGFIYQDLGGFHSLRPTLQVETRNCIFANCYGGARYESAGGQSVHPWYGFIGNLVWLYASNQNNIYTGITRSALAFSAEAHTAEAAGQVNNCTFNAAGCGIEYSANFAVNAFNNIFDHCGVALTRDTAAGQAGFNCFWNNQTNFAGYSPNYGSLVTANLNGTPCDVAFNIFQDPQFAGPQDFHLAPASPCVDAGDPSAVAADACLLPPALGTSVNDLGAYGGPGSCAWFEGMAPTIVRQPQSASSCLGRTITLSVQAAGTPPFICQWYRNGAVVPGATDTNLTLANLATEQAGTYTVSISNAFGTVTSQPATLAVSDVCLDLQMYAGLTITGQPGSTYELRYTTDLANTNFSTWSVLATQVMTDAGWFYLDRESPSSPRRFYGARIMQP